MLPIQLAVYVAEIAWLPVRFGRWLRDTALELAWRVVGGR
jgi:hypothetical protein